MIPFPETKKQIKLGVISSPPMHILFCHHSHLICLENLFRSSTIKLYIVSGEIFTNIICVALVIPKNACMTILIICMLSCILFRKQPFTDVLRNRCFWKLCPIRRKAHVLEYLFNKVTSLQIAILLKERLRLWYFPVILNRISRTTFLRLFYKVSLLIRFFILACKRRFPGEWSAVLYS